MHSQILKSSVLATFGATIVFWAETARSTEWYDGQEILVECPNWDWEVSQIPEVVYELCFDDIDQCTVADSGDSVCVPDLGDHDVWVTAIDYQGADPIYYDGDIASIRRARSADFNGNGRVEFHDLFTFLDQLGVTGDTSQDLDGDGVVDLGDLWIFLDDFGKCVSESGDLYEAC